MKFMGSFAARLAACPWLREAVVRLLLGAPTLKARLTAGLFGPPPDLPPAPEAGLPADAREIYLNLLRARGERARDGPAP
jgi:hypothetical protein